MEALGMCWNCKGIFSTSTKGKKPLKKTTEEAKNLTNPQAMANPIIPRDISNIMKIVLAILQQNQAN